MLCESLPRRGKVSERSCVSETASLQEKGRREIHGDRTRTSWREGESGDEVIQHHKHNLLSLLLREQSRSVTRKILHPRLIQVEARCTSTLTQRKTLRC